MVLESLTSFTLRQQCQSIVYIYVHIFIAFTNWNGSNYILCNSLNMSVTSYTELWADWRIERLNWVDRRLV